MQYAIIDSGQVVNVAEADADFAASQCWIAAPAGVGIGWAYDGEVFTAPPPEPVPVPAAVTMRQARLALLGAGLLGDIDAAINSLPSPQKEAAQIEWEYAAEVQRASGLVPQLGDALGLDDAALDDLFVAASKL